jgi:hypothetical protein
VVRQAGAAQHRPRHGNNGVQRAEEPRGWGKLAHKLGVKGIHIAERDTQRSKKPKPMNVFVNTWSVEGFLSEGMQPAELGWGTHEKWMPDNAASTRTGCGAAIYLLQPGANTRVRSWCPTAGRAIRLPRHPQRVDLDRRLFHGARRPARRDLPADLPLRLSPLQRRGAVAARMFGQAGKMQPKHHILDENEIVDGIDELGVLLYGHGKNAYWYGSQLSIEETRAIAPYQNATGMQVTSAVLAGMVWALENPNAGIVEADEMDFRRCLEVQTPYLGPVIGAYTDWTPLTDRPGCSRRTSTERSLAVPERAGAVVFYAVKANPAPEVLSLLASLGSCFDCASVVEIEMALAAGATPDRISFGNTIKKERDIARALRSACACSRSIARPRSRRSPAPRPAPRCSAASSATAPAPNGRCRASSAARRRWRSTCSTSPSASAWSPMASRSMSARSSAR